MSIPTVTYEGRCFEPPIRGSYCGNCWKSAVVVIYFEGDRKNNSYHCRKCYKEIREVHLVDEPPNWTAVRLPTLEELREQWGCASREATKRRRRT